MADRYLAFVNFTRERSGDWGPLFRHLADATGYALAETGAFIVIAQRPTVEIGRDGLEGLVVGTMFRRGERHPVASLTAGEAETIVGSAGEALIGDFWGHYVALVRGSGCHTAVIRAPMGDLACYYQRCADGLLVASDADLLFRALRIRPAIDWDAVARHLIAPNLCRAQTCLASILELGGGERLAASSGASPAELWNPWSFVAADRRCNDKQAATDLVRETVLTSVAARAGCDDRTVLLLSGGLDSSIVAAALARADHSFTGLTMVTHAPGGDERGFARSVATHCGFPLHEVVREVSMVDLERSAASDLPYPSERSFSQATRAAAEAIAVETGATAILHGGGGDNVFCSLQSAAPLADLVRTEGLTRSAIALADDIAIIAQSTHVAVIKQAIARLLWRSPRYRWEALTELLSGKGQQALAAALEHRWLNPPRGALSGSAGQIGVLLAALSLVQSPSAAARYPWRSVLLAQPIVEACLSVPTWLWFDRGRNRAIARRAFAPLLPQSIAWRPSKGAMDSFVVEIFEANRAKLTAMVLDGHLMGSGLIDRAAVERVLCDRGPVRGTSYSRLMQFADLEAWLTSWIARGVS